MESYKNKYIEMLRNELDNRFSSRPSYSLRAFARDLGPSPSQISLVLNKKLGLSKKSAVSISSRVNWAEAERALFCDLVIAADGRSKRA